MTEALSCPRCIPTRNDGGYRTPDASVRARQALVPMTWEAEIAVLRCARRDGIWLREGQLAEIRHTRGADYGSADEQIVALERGAREAARRSEDERELDCPSCGKPMVRSPYRRSHVLVDTCMSCGGCFVDREGLEQIEMQAEVFG